MPPARKYDDFLETEPEVKPGKKAPWTEDKYVGITCPHCSKLFVEITVDSLKSSKASQCLKHLRVCTEYTGTVTTAPEKKHKDPAISSLMERMQELESMVASQETTIATHDAVIKSQDAQMKSICDENAFLKSENAELEEALSNARAALRSQRKHLLSELESADARNQMDVPIMRIENGLC